MSEKAYLSYNKKPLFLKLVRLTKKTIEFYKLYYFHLPDISVRINRTYFDNFRIPAEYFQYSNEATAFKASIKRSRGLFPYTSIIFLRG